MVARRTSLRRQRGQNQGKGRTGVWAGPAKVVGSGIMNAHNVYGRILWIVVLQDSFSINIAAGKRKAEVIMEGPNVPFRARFSNLIGHSATLKMVIHGFGNVFQRQPSEFVCNPVQGGVFGRDKASVI